MLKKYLYKLLGKYLSFYIGESASVVEISLFGKLLLKEKTRNRNYKLVSSPEELSVQNPDFVVLNSNVHYEKDIQCFFNKIYENTGSGTRLIIFYYSRLWRLLIKIATLLNLRNKTPEDNWVTHEDIENLLLLTNFEIVRREAKVIFPIYIPLLSSFLNRILGTLPFFRLFSLVNIVVARPVNKENNILRSVSIIVPAKNEEGNIEEIAKKIPLFTPDDELIFIEGNSKDNTWQKINEVAEKYKTQRKILIGRQDGKGKGDAVRKGFAMASGDILIIFDADITVPPEDLVKFYNAIKENKGEFINGSRLVYPMEKKAMRFFNVLGNKFFAMSFSSVIGQRFKDTLCGTKVISRKNYLKLIENRKYFGEFDPFGDFDLIFGATKLALKIVEVPITYRERTYGDTNIQRWKHGVILLKMLFFAMRKIKFI